MTATTQPATSELHVLRHRGQGRRGAARRRAAALAGRARRRGAGRADRRARERGGASFAGPLALGYRACLWSRRRAARAAAAGHAAARRRRRGLLGRPGRDRLDGASVARRHARRRLRRSRRGRGRDQHAVRRAAHQGRDRRPVPRALRPPPLGRPRPSRPARQRLRRPPRGRSWPRPLGREPAPPRLPRARRAGRGAAQGDARRGRPAARRLAGDRGRRGQRRRPALRVGHAAHRSRPDGRRRRPRAAARGRRADGPRWGFHRLAAATTPRCGRGWWRRRASAAQRRSPACARLAPGAPQRPKLGAASPSATTATRAPSPWRRPTSRAPVCEELVRIETPRARRPSSRPSSPAWRARRDSAARRAPAGAASGAGRARRSRPAWSSPSPAATGAGWRRPIARRRAPRRTPATTRADPAPRRPCARRLYELLGDASAAEFAGWQAAILVNDLELGKRLGLRARRTNRFMNGPLPCTLLRIEIDGARRRAARPARPAGGRRADRDRRRVGASGRGSAPDEAEQRRGSRRPRAAAAASPAPLARGRAVRQPAAQERPALEPLHAPRRHHLLPRLRRRPARLRPGHRRLRALGARAGVRAAARDRRGQGGGAPRRGHARRARGAGRGAGRRVPQGARPAARRRAVRAPRPPAASSTRSTRATSPFLVNFTDYLDTGLFLPGREVRRLLAGLATGQRFLNLFGYTGTASVAAGKGGAASTTTVDLNGRLPRVGPAQLRPQQAQAGAQRGGRGRRPAAGSPRPTSGSA